MPRSLGDRARSRRAWTAFGEELKDLEEDYSAAKEAGSTGPEFEAIKKKMSDTRRAYRQLGEELGLRSGFTATELPIWRNWFEVAVDHERIARAAYQELLAGQNRLEEELPAALVAVTASAFTVEALHEDIVDLIPADPKAGRRNRVGQIRYALQTAFDPPTAKLNELMGRVGETFRLRNIAVHAYIQVLPTEPHPAGLNSGIDNAYFNAVTAAQAIDSARDIVRLARDGAAQRRWMQRWQNKRQGYFSHVERAERSRASEPRPDAVEGWEIPRGIRETE